MLPCQCMEVTGKGLSGVVIVESVVFVVPIVSPSTPPALALALTEMSGCMRHP